MKRKYNLTVNCVMILNGAYLLYVVMGKPFTRRQMRDFVTYYNPKRVNMYIGVLMDKGFISLAGLKATRQLYCISELGLQVINDLNKSYQEQLYVFCNKYNIEL